MTTEEFQRLVLEKFSILTGEITSLKGNVSTLTSDVASLKGNVSTLTSDVASLKEAFSKLPTKEELNQITADQQKDIISILELTNDKLARVETKVDILHKRSLEQETDIQLLKKAK